MVCLQYPSRPSKEAADWALASDLQLLELQALRIVQRLCSAIISTNNFYDLSALRSPDRSCKSHCKFHTRQIFTMVLEATMVVVDNSESSRNGDYTPTRFEAQSDAVSLIFSAITQANPESSVGLMSMGGKGPEVLVTLTTDHGKILEGLHRTKSKIRGNAHLATGIQIAGVSQKWWLWQNSTIANSCTNSLRSSIVRINLSVNE